MSFVKDRDGNVFEFPEQIKNRFARMLRARSVSYDEAMEMMVEMLVHMHPEDKDRFLIQVYLDIKNHYPKSIHEKDWDAVLARGKAIMEIPIYQFEDKTTKELDELLSNEKCDFLTKQEMII